MQDAYILKSLSWNKEEVSCFKFYASAYIIKPVAPYSLDAYL